MTYKETPNVNDEKSVTTNTTGQPLNKTMTKKNKILLAILLIPIIFLIGAIILSSKWNLIMGSSNFKSGDYETALEYYTQEINSGNTDAFIQDRHKALSAYISAEQAYKNDHIEELSKYINVLNNTQSEYPTKEEINILTEKYNKRSEEIKSYEESINKITELFSDTTKIDTVITMCDELSEKNISAAQKSRLEDIKANAANYIYITATIKQIMRRS